MQERTDVEVLNQFYELQHLTPKELRLWRILWEARGQEVTASAMAERMFNDPDALHSLRNAIAALRRKLRGTAWRIKRAGYGLYRLHAIVEEGEL